MLCLNDLGMSKRKSANIQCFFQRTLSVARIFQALETICKKKKKFRIKVGIIMSEINKKVHNLFLFDTKSVGREKQVNVGKA